MERVSIFSRSTLAMPPRSLHSSPLLRYADDAAKQQPQSSDAEGKTGETIIPPVSAPR